MSPIIASSRIASALGCPLQQKFNCHVRHSHTTRLSHVESSHLLGKNYESLLSRVRLLVCFQWLAWQFACLISMWNMNNIHSWEKIFCRHKHPASPAMFLFSAEKWSRCPAYGGQTIHAVPVLEISGCANKHLSRLVPAVVLRLSSP